jgi:hypothetical protein
MTSVIATVIRAVWLQSCPNVPSTQATIKLFTKHNDKKPTIMYDIYLLMHCQFPLMLIVVNTMVHGNTVLLYNI